MTFAAFLLVAYLSGALPWSVWLGKWFFKADPRALGDGNPGAANAFRAGGWPLGVSVLVLDFLKAFLPVFAARWMLQLPAHQLGWIALMPTLGHAFSIFLRFRGGRALVTLFGVWSGLTLYEVPLVMGGAALVSLRLFRNDLLRALLLPLVVIIYLPLRGEPGWMLALAAAQLGILVSKIAAHQTGLQSE